MQICTKYHQKSELTAPMQKIDATKVQKGAGTKMHKCLVGLSNFSANTLIIK